MSAILTFDTTHHALWAEQIAGAERLGVQVVHSPPDSGARCDLALEVLDDDVAALCSALDTRGVAYRRYAGTG